ncbi:MAG: tryptophan--tRNA ligase, partial [Clostridia bacterium]|nr:tryptophan--tRNA ligase [Clostridia bacterium]
MIGDVKTVLSGVQPSGNLTIGNYLGAIKNFSAFAGEYKPFYCVVDLHAITVRQVPAELRRRTYETLALYIASGLDPEKNVLFVQSHVPAHAELGWILDCYTMFGELSRMTQFKDKSAKHADNINAGLFTYPTLMAADILLYQADLVPIGADQKQHLELARNIADRFNQVYGDTFTVPEPYIPAAGMKIMSLQEPTLKMSKSDPNPNAVVRILDPRDEILRKFKRAVTDSGAEVRFSPDKPGVSNLMTIYSCFSGKSFAEIEAEFAGKGYGDFKLAVGEVTADALAPVQAEFN